MVMPCHDPSSDENVAMRYWLGIDSPAVWQEVRQKHDLQGLHPFAFPSRRGNSVRKIEVGHRIINYMKDMQRFFAVWEVTAVPKGGFSEPQIYAGREFPECVQVRPLVLVEPS